MTAIDIKDWKEFELGFLFNIVKGSRLTKAEMKEGETRFIGSSSMNNGCTALVGNQKGVHEGNAITVCYNGSVGETFYQDQPFLASDDVNILCPKFKMNENIALFLSPIIKKTSGKYGFNNKWKKEIMIKEKIPLPIDSNGNPDWEYMDEYMAKVLKESEASLENLKQVNVNKNKNNTKDWKEFRLEDLFLIKNTQSIILKNIVPDSGDTPYVTSKEDNNGVHTMIECKKEWMEEGWCILIGGKTMAFSFQENPFCSNDSHNISLALKGAERRSRETHLFLITAIRMAMGGKYSWSDSISKARIKKEKIFLPYDSQGNPDWEYMDEYMAKALKEAETTITAVEEING